MPARPLCSIPPGIWYAVGAEDVIDAGDRHRDLAGEHNAELLMLVAVRRHEGTQVQLDEVDHRRVAEQREHAHPGGEVVRPAVRDLHDLSHARKAYAPRRIRARLSRAMFRPVPRACHAGRHAPGENGRGRRSARSLDHEPVLRG